MDRSFCPSQLLWGGEEFCFCAESAFIFFFFGGKSQARGIGEVKQKQHVEGIFPRNLAVMKVA